MIDEKTQNKWDDLTEEILTHKFHGDYITISKYGRFHIKYQSIDKHEDFRNSQYVDIRYSKSQNALVFIFNSNGVGLKLTFSKRQPNTVTFGSMHFFTRLNLNFLTQQTKKYVAIKEKIPVLGEALVIYLEKCDNY